MADIKLRLEAEDDGTVVIKQVEEEYKKSMDGMADSTEEADRRIKRSVNNTNNTLNNFSSHSSSTFSKIKTALYSKLVNPFKTGFTMVGNYLKASISQLQTFALGAGALGSILSTAAIGAFGKSILSAASQMENFTQQFEVFYGSVEKAGEALAMVRQVAATTPFQLPQVIQTTKILKVLTNGALATSEGIRMVGDASVAAGVPINELATWFGRLYSMLQAGRPAGEAMMRLMELGVVSADVRSKIEKLQAAGAEANTVWNVFMQSQSKFSGLMSKQMNTLSGIISNMGDNFLELRTTIGNELLGSVKEVAREIRDWLGMMSKSPQAVQFGRNLATGFNLAVTAAKALFGYLESRKEALLLVGKIVGGFVALKIAILAVSNPLIIVLGLLFGAVELITRYGDDVQEMTQTSIASLNQWKEEHKSVLTKVGDFFKFFLNQQIKFVAVYADIWKTGFLEFVKMAKSAFITVIADAKRFGTILVSAIKGDFDTVKKTFGEFLTEGGLLGLYVPDFVGLFKDQINDIKTIMETDYVEAVVNGVKTGATNVVGIVEDIMNKLKDITKIGGMDISSNISDIMGGGAGGGDGVNDLILDRLEFNSDTQKIMQEYFERIYRGAIDGGLKAGAAFKYGFEEALFNIGTEAQIMWEAGSEFAKNLHEGLTTTFSSLMQGGGGISDAITGMLQNLTDTLTTHLSEMISKPLVDGLSDKMSELTEKYGKEFLGYVAGGLQLVNGTISGDTTQIGSGIGMLAGTAIGGPIGGMIGGFAGGMLGGLFSDDKEVKDNISDIADNTAETNVRLEVVNRNLMGLRADVTELWVLPTSAYFSTRNVNNELSTQLSMVGG